ncbi:sialate O-acetylesterase [Polaribacter haliotis]|uniref:Sialate O-acetylesterase n=1 Tax=Polaribacter haliotis TaxID=1888915 RepID=A0A7L8ACT6_9FLAO|nr:sialate O-acetylesterase [Polaribacter haliotis]QOD59744.1 sialate O-acetylesterase [Polaribacter haliotis]
MKKLLFILIFLLITSCKITRNVEKSSKDLRTINFPKKEIKVSKSLDKENIWVYIMAGQSNMAGRGFVEPKDTISNTRILTINSKNEIIYAKEPLHFYEPSGTGLDLGMSFAKEIITRIPDSISILMIPTAVGGSSIEQWIENKKHRNIKLLDNFKNKVEVAKTYGIIKGVLWHQGESDTNNQILIDNYGKNLYSLFAKFRQFAGNEELPIIVGELGSYSTNKENWRKLNEKIINYVKTDPNVKVVKTSDLTDKGDKLHFDSKSIRILGKRYAKQIIKH